MFSLAHKLPGKTLYVVLQAFQHRYCYFKIMYSKLVELPELYILSVK